MVIVLSYISGLRLAWATRDPVPKHPQKFSGLCEGTEAETLTPTTQGFHPTDRMGGAKERTGREQKAEL